MSHRTSDENQKSLFMNWLGEHGSRVMKVVLCLHPHQRGVPGPRGGDSARGLAVLAEIRG